MWIEVEVDIDDIEALERIDNEFIREYIQGELGEEVPFEPDDVLDEIFKRVKLQGEDLNVVIGDLMRQKGIYDFNV